MKKLLAALVVLAFAAPPALAAVTSVKVSPGTVKPGKAVRVYGTATGCPAKDTVILTSKAFKGAKHSFAGVPALYAKQATKHAYSVTFTISKKVKKGTYPVGGRCGGGNIGGTTLKVS